MATYTENYNLLMTETDDYFDILDYNENFETIDTALAETAAQVKTLSTQTASVIKSIQHIVYTCTYDEPSATLTISEINPEKCFVILERLRDNTTSLTEVVYTLEETALTVEGAITGSSQKLKLGFWIIEFN